MSGQWYVEDVPAFLDLLDEVDVRVVLNLAGGWGALLEHSLDRHDRAHPERIITFCSPSCAELPNSDDIEGMLSGSVRMSADQGARGVFLTGFASGLIRDRWDQQIAIDDPRLDEMFASCAEAGLPTIVDAPVDEDGDINGFDQVLTRHPDTRFALARVSDVPLDTLTRLLNSHLNLSVLLDVSAEALTEERRQWGDLVREHPDRFIFASGSRPPTAEDYRRRFHLFEARADRDGYALTLPTLAQLYAGNAVSLLSARMI